MILTWRLVPKFGYFRHRFLPHCYGPTFSAQLPAVTASSHPFLQSRSGLVGHVDVLTVEEMLNLIDLEPQLALCQFDRHRVPLIQGEKRILNDLPIGIFSGLGVKKGARP